MPLKLPALSTRIAILAGAACLLAGSSGCAQRSAAAGPRAAVLYPLPPAPARIAYLTSIDDERFMGYQPDRLALFLLGHDSKRPATITKPFGLAAGDESLLVCDTQQNVVHVLDFKRRRFEKLGSSGQGRLLKPVAVALDQDGNRYVADTGRGQVVVFSPENEAIRALGLPPETPFKPVGVAWHDGKLYVLNAAQPRVDVLDPTTGAVLGAIGEQGAGPGQMLLPCGLAVDADGRIYVSDLLNCQVQVFGPDQRPVRSFGRAGDRAGEFSRPKHVAVGPDGVAYVVDAAFQRVQMFDADGRVLMLFGGPGDEPGSMTLPAGICVDRTLLPYFAEWIPPGFEAEYLVFVACQFGPRKIGVYAFGSPRGADSSPADTGSR